MIAGYSAIPSEGFLRELEDDQFRNGFMADHVRTRFALLVRSLREQRGWSQAELGRRMGKPQSVVSRIEDPDYGRLSIQTVFEVAAAFGLPVYIDLPNWDEWFRLMEDMSGRNLQRHSFDAGLLNSLATSPLQQPEIENITPLALALRQKQCPHSRLTSARVESREQAGLGVWHFVGSVVIPATTDHDEAQSELISLMRQSTVPAPSPPWGYAKP